ncbi:DEAD/DEAH box helicase family protein [Dolosigranulum pigrum]|jgi:type III restriction enzyme, res subunit
MNEQFLYEKLEILAESGKLESLPSVITSNLSKHINLREYQKEAFQYFIEYIENENLHKSKQLHTLFHMATGSGKTVIMAGLILYLYASRLKDKEAKNNKKQSEGYRNFLFFVDQTTIIEKTKENFSNKNSSKYLFSKVIDYLGLNIYINIVDNFSNVSTDDASINICFTTTAKLHSDLTIPKENTLTYDDFKDKKIVFISDESHHLNAMTKAQSSLKEDEKLNKNSWEKSIMNAFGMNKNNILLEFTATCDLNNNAIKEKYIDKIVYNYPLKDFRQSGFTKDFQNLSTNSSQWERTLIALIISEYRRHLFADVDLNINPIVLLKSGTVVDSKEFYSKFFRQLKKLSIADLLALESKNKQSSNEIKILSKALDYFKNKDQLSSFGLLAAELKISFNKKNSIIMNSTTDNTTEKQLLVNSLEDKDNPIRFIFTVDMLEEGWDVLNLFDIVRLYENAPGRSSNETYSTSEAQLIGRGARYCPFKIKSEQSRYTRKYDDDLNDDYRVLETMYFHSINDSNYIAALRRSLIETGMEDKNKDKNIQTYKLKDSFKQTELYKQGWVFSNKRKSIGRYDVQEIEHNMKDKTFVYESRFRGHSGFLFDESNYNLEEDKHYDEHETSFVFKEIDYNILGGAAERYTELQFNMLTQKYPNISSVKEFLTDDNYLGNNILKIHHDKEKVSGRDIFEGLCIAFSEISSHIANVQGKFIGSKEFSPYKISDVIKDKTVYLSLSDKGGGTGSSQIKNVNENYRVNLKYEDWYVFEDNYGTTEEKSLVKYFENNIVQKLKEKNLSFYLVRNERFPELAIYNFEDGARFEPDFLLFVEKPQNNKHEQVYIEPKGSFLIDYDKWKEDFLLSIENESEIKGTVHVNSKDYFITGLPFYSETNSDRMNKFKTAIGNWIDKL